MMKHQDRVRAAFERDHGARGRKFFFDSMNWWTKPQLELHGDFAKN